MNPHKQHVTILHIEDNPHDAFVMKKIFSKFTSPICSLIHTEDGQKAVELLESGLRPDMILCDIHLPNMNGMEFVQYIKNIEALRYIPVIMMSGAAIPEDAVACYRRHANAFMVKPIELQQLRDMAQMLVGFWFRHSFYPPSLTENEPQS